MSNSSRFNNRLKNREEELKEDKGTCINCTYQGNCPYADGTCSRSYYHKVYSDKIKKSVDKFKLRWYNKYIKGKVTGK